MDLPGFTKDEVQATLENGYLTVQAEKGLDKEEKEKETGHYIRKERYAGFASFFGTKSFRIPCLNSALMSSCSTFSPT